MSLNYATLNRKPIIELDNKSTGKDKCLDLLSKVFDSDYIVNLASLCEVNEYYVARPDLISLAFYGTDQYADIICKINGISNPFELNEGQIIYIPSLDDISSFIVSSIGSSAKSEMIESSLKSNSRKIGLKLLSDTRSPSSKTVADAKNYTTVEDLGIVIY